MRCSNRLKTAAFGVVSFAALGAAAMPAKAE